MNEEERKLYSKRLAIKEIARDILYKERKLIPELKEHVDLVYLMIDHLDTIDDVSLTLQLSLSLILHPVVFQDGNITERNPTHYDVRDTLKKYGW